jgi:flagellar biosynthesis anti-sigma factor FlgM
VDNGKPDRNRVAPATSQHESDKAAPDQARITFDQSRVRALETQVLAQPEVRQQRVDLLRQSLGKGEYSVSDTQLADAILADITNGSSAQPTG